MSPLPDPCDDGFGLGSTFLNRIDHEIASVIAARPVDDFTDHATRRALTERNRQARRDAFVPDERVEIVDHVAVRDPLPDLVVRGYHRRDLDGPRPGLYWIHGGGHLVGSVDQDDALLQEWCLEVGCDAFSVDWRPSPDDPFPAEMIDAVTGLMWVVGHAGQWDIDVGRIAIGGASSGGGSALALALLLRDHGIDGALEALADASRTHNTGNHAVDAACLGTASVHQNGNEFKPAAIVVIYPMLDDRNVTRSSHQIVEPRVWNRDKNLFAWRCYLGDAAGTSRVSPYAAPARADDVSGLAPTYMATGTLDLFVDENLDFVSRMISDGVDVELHLYPGAPHGFFTAVPHAALSRRLVADVTNGLRRLLTP
ncbi:MAG: alpha/beta hydrolase fold domain-containing protein [Nitriliruptoraceae bacterium]